METSKWRKWAKLVAYCDLVGSSMLLLLVILSVFGVGFMHAVANDPTLLDGTDLSPAEVSASHHALKTHLWELWGVVGFLTVFTGIQLWAAVHLMVATEVGREASKALTKSATWRNASLLLIIVELVQGLVMGSYGSFAITLLIRGIAIGIVHKFMQELCILLHPMPKPMATV